MHDSFTPLGGLVPLFNLHLGEVVFGGVGTGLAGMIVMAVLTVFIAGLMVGRTPEYLGKKIEAYEMKLAMLYILIFRSGNTASDRSGRTQQGRAVFNRQLGTARLQRNSLCVLLRRGQQRLSVCRAERQHHVLQFVVRRSDVVRAVRHDDSRSWLLPVRWLQKKAVPASAGTFPYQWNNLS